MRYWSELGVTTHIFDGSHNSIQDIEKLGLNDCIFYHHIPLGFIDRLRLAMDFVKTEYCALCGDDEFYLESGIISTIRTLENNLDLVACAGRAAGFHYLNKRMQLRMIYPEQNKYAVLQDYSFDRMQHHMRFYSASTIYSVVRKEQWLNAMEVVVNKEYPVFALGELQFEMMIAFQGKSKIIDDLYWLRNLGNKGIRNTDISLNTSNHFGKWWKNPDKKNEIADVIDLMASAMEKCGAISKANAKDIVNCSFEAYYIFQHELYSPASTANRIFRNLIGFSRWVSVEKYLDEHFQPNHTVVLNDIHAINNYMK
jgi:glycosyltransferase domain-containing protein